MPKIKSDGAEEPTINNKHKIDNKKLCIMILLLCIMTILFCLVCTTFTYLYLFTDTIGYVDSNHIKVETDFYKDVSIDLLDCYLAYLHVKYNYILKLRTTVDITLICLFNCAHLHVHLQYKLNY